MVLARVTGSPVNCRMAGSKGCIVSRTLTILKRARPANRRSAVANNIAFQPMGKTWQANANTVSQMLTITPDSPCNQLCVASHEAPTSGKAVYFRVSNLSNVTVTSPNPGNATYCTVIVPGTVKTYTVPFQFSPTAPLYVAFIAEQANSEAYFTPGEGL